MDGLLGTRAKGKWQHWLRRRDDLAREATGHAGAGLPPNDGQARPTPGLLRGRRLVQERRFPRQGRVVALFVRSPREAQLTLTFFVRMRTEVRPVREEDERAVQAAYLDPEPSVKTHAAWAFHGCR